MESNTEDNALQNKRKKNPIDGGGKVWNSENRYKALLEINNAIINQACREDLFRCIAKEINRWFDYDRFSISIYESDSNSLTVFAIAEGIPVKGIDDGPRSMNVDTVAKAVITSRKPLIITDLFQYAHWSTIKSMISAGLRATAAFPLIARGRVLGSLHFSFKCLPLMMDELADFLSDLSGQVALAVDNMLSHTKLVDLNRNLEQQKSYLMNHVDTQYRPDDFHYSSPVMKEVMAQVEIIADSDASVLITGETGTGKDYIARYIHHLSGRRDAMFVKVTCPALAESLFESEMFGHAKGAFTGANSKRIGRFEMASGGTIFLDEIGELPLPLQAKLLHVLQDMRFERVGDSYSIAVDFRVIAATNRDLGSAIHTKEFRSDLYYRLNTVAFHVPPLRERREEIEPLIRQLTYSQSENMRRMPPVYSDQAMELMKGHSWPGNVRELKNIVTRLIIVFSGKTVNKKDIEPLLNIQHSEPAGPMTLSEVERAHLIKVLSMTKGVVGGKNGAAGILRIPKSTLQYRLYKHGIDPLDFAQ